ncbi:MAG: aryldialkylphosphatase [SAR202 cluster bacterium]|nr:aryldialkylphosphatase [SAR202 cluster bacterium]
MMPPSDMAGKVQTVLGPIEPQSLGVTMTHEHLLIDLMSYFTMPEEASTRWYADRPITMDILGKIGQVWYINKANLQQYDLSFAIEEVLQYKYAGGNAIVDTTSVGLARDPLALARIARATGLNVVMGGSYYIPISYPAGMEKKTETQIADEIISDITVGVGDTGVKTGVIGEVGCMYPLSETEKRVLRGSAYASIETGCPITIHPGFHNDSPHEILEVLTEAGADPKNIIMGHIGPTVRDLAILKDLAQSGCYIQHDLFGFELSDLEYMGEVGVSISDVQRMERLEFLIDGGFLGQLLVGQDVCQLWQYRRYGGKGYAHILENIVPRMRKRGFTEQQVHAILVDNPARALAFKPAKATRKSAKGRKG